MQRATGTVKWFSQEKGFGFIQREDGPDVFVHFSSIQSRGFRTLEQGEPVEFEILEEPKGLKAQNVVRLNPPAVAEAAPAVRAPGAGAYRGAVDSGYRGGVDSGYRPSPAYGATPPSDWDRSRPDHRGGRGRDDARGRERGWERSDRWD